MTRLFLYLFILNKEVNKLYLDTIKSLYSVILSDVVLHCRTYSVNREEGALCRGLECRLGL